MAALLKVDTVGRAYIGIAVTWSVVLYSAMGVLWYHRQLPQLHMRRLTLVFVALTILHIYWTLCMVGYVIAPVVPCAAEYWIMSILLPFGIAIFQVANSQFLHVACEQRRFTQTSDLSSLPYKMRRSTLEGQALSLPQKLLRSLRQMDRITRLIIFVSVSMAVQAVLAILVFLLSRKFHPSFGVTAETTLGSKSDQRAQCGRGWEWWPSIIWQVFWAWFYGPFILWKARNIQDTHGWRIQTILCCIVGLPCTPLWLCGLYLSQFAPVNVVFAPRNWFAASIFCIQWLTIFIPCYQVYRHYRLRTITLNAIAKCETSNGSLSYETIDDEATQVDWSSNRSYIIRTNSDKLSSSTLISRLSVVDITKKSHLYTIVALEWTLAWSPSQLQEFAALKDFSGENIAFLTQVAKWKKLWSTRNSVMQSSFTTILLGENGREPILESVRRKAFNHAMALYCVSVSPDYAEFPINICCQTRQRLDCLFARPAAFVLGSPSPRNTIDAAAPFASDRVKSTAMEVEETRDDGVATGILRLHGVYYDGDIPTSFTPDCFGEAEDEIKYLVLTNTWPRFVQIGHAEQVRDPEGRSLETRLAQHYMREPCR